MSSRKNSFKSFSEIKLSYHPKIKMADRISVKNQLAATAVLRESWDSDLINLKEQFKILLLSNSCHVMGIADMSSGGFDATSTDIRLIFATALKARCNNIILAHNHPSGSLAASKEDVLLTHRIMEAGHLLNVTISDHIIMTSEGSYSMNENDLL